VTRRPQRARGRSIVRLDSGFGGGAGLRIEEGASRDRFVLALASATRTCTWIVPDLSAMTGLLEAAQVVLEQDRRPRSFGGLVALEPTKPSTTPVLVGLFDPVVGACPSFHHLPYEALVEVMALPAESARDLVIGGWSNLENELLILVRGDLRTVVAPFSMFARTPRARPAFRKLAIEDHGHTVRLGSYEASTDSILHDLDPDYRRRLNARRRASDRGLGPALRRLRVQRGLSRSDFEGISAKTLARIERGEITQPRSATVRALEATLGLKLDEIASF
jgi:hypothetical protein